MKFWQWRSYRKLVKHMLHEARHARHVRGDIAAAEDLAGLREAEESLREAWRARSAEQIDDAVDVLARAVRTVYPVRRAARLRENAEILIVAVAVAMAFRTYFVQPFKIPTGSMQPTLYGIHIDEQRSRGLMDVFPLSLFNLVIFGERYVEVKAPVGGVITDLGASDEYRVYEVRGNAGSGMRKIHRNMQRFFKPGQYVAKGALLAAGRTRHGDHIFVDKVRYNFSRPKRGNIFVFSTDGVDYDQIRENTFYIKRLVGLPGERVSVKPPYLMINGKPISEPYAFKRLVDDPEYSGYGLVSHPTAQARLRRESDAIQLADGQYLPFGDNTDASLDGRFFGPVRQQSIVGPAFMVYWPFGERWGLAR